MKMSWVGMLLYSTPPEMGKVGCARLSGKKEGISAIRQRNMPERTAMNTPADAIKHPGTRKKSMSFPSWKSPWNRPRGKKMNPAAHAFQKTHLKNKGFSPPPSNPQTDRKVNARRELRGDKRGLVNIFPHPRGNLLPDLAGSVNP